MKGILLTVRKEKKKKNGGWLEHGSNTHMVGVAL